MTETHDHLEANAIQGERAPFAPETKAVICVPCHDGEKNLSSALYRYLHLESAQQAQIEICVLVNSPLEKESSAYKTATAFFARHKSLKGTVYVHGYEPDTPLENIRMDLLKLVKERAVSSATSPILVSQDADNIYHSPFFVDEVVGQFEVDPELDAVAGFVDYPVEDLGQDHIFYVMQVFEDVLEAKIREKTGQVVMRGANSAFRASTLDHPAFESAFAPNNAPVFLKPRPPVEGIKIVANDELGWVTSSARRQMSALGAQTPIRLAHRYSQDIQIILSESAHKVTSEGFSGVLADELSALYSTAVQNQPYGLDAATLQTLFLETAQEMLLRISFEADSIHVDDITELRDQLLRDHSRF